MKTSMTFTLLATMAITLTGCGGGGGSSSSSKLVASSPSTTPTATPSTTPTATPTATPSTRPTATPTANSSYTTLQDLEYKTLTLKEYWHTIKDTTKNKTYSTMIFKESYNKGYLVDEQSGKNGARVCSTLNEGKYKYFCVTVYPATASATKPTEVHIFNISDNNQVTGNYAYSPTADNDELARLVSSRETAHAWITGTATTTRNKTTSHLINEVNKEKSSLIKSTSTFNKSTPLTEKEEDLINLLVEMKASLSK